MTLESLDDVISNSFIERDEFEFYTRMVRDNYTGSGVIIDGGCFTGASTLALCEGLAALDLYRDGSRRVVAIDRFVAMDPYVVSHFQEQRSGIEFGASFLTQFLHTLREHIHCLDVRAGELVQVGKVSEQVEIAVVDIAKSSGLNAFIARNWYTRMTPEVSLLLHQDFFAPSHPWIAVSMGALLDYFDLVEERIGEGATFRLVKPIPVEELEEAVSLGHNSPAAVHRLDALIERLLPVNAAPIQIMKAMIYFRLGQQCKAQLILEDLLGRSQPPFKKWEQWLAIATVAVMPTLYASDSLVSRMYASHASVRLGK